MMDGVTGVVPFFLVVLRVGCRVSWGTGMRAAGKGGEWKRSLKWRMHVSRNTCNLITVKFKVSGPLVLIEVKVCYQGRSIVPDIRLGRSRTMTRIYRANVNNR